MNSDWFVAVFVMTFFRPSFQNHSVSILPLVAAVVIRLYNSNALLHRKVNRVMEISILRSVIILLLTVRLFFFSLT